MNIVLGIIIIYLIATMEDEKEEACKKAYLIPLSVSIIAIAAYNIIRIFV